MIWYNFKVEKQKDKQTNSFLIKKMMKLQYYLFNLHINITSNNERLDQSSIIK